MKTTKHIYYVRTSPKTDQEPIWSEWYGPILAYGPFTAALHFAALVPQTKERTKVLTQIISQTEETLQIEFNVNYLETAKSVTLTKQKPTKQTHQRPI